MAPKGSHTLCGAFLYPLAREGEKMTNEELVNAIQHEDRKEKRTELLTALWNQTAGFIQKIAWGYAKKTDNPHEMYEDLKQECFLALLDAVNSFDSSIGCTFLTHAAYYLKGKIIRYITESKTMKVPVNAMFEILEFDRIRNEYAAKHGRTPGRVILWREYGIKPSQYDKIMMYKRRLSTKSLSDPVTGKDGSTEEAGDLIPSGEDLEGDVTDKVRQEELEKILWGYVDQLPGRAPDILRSRYQRGETQKAIADRYGVNRTLIAATESQACRKLGMGKSGRALRPFLTDGDIYSRGLRHSNFSSTWYSSTEAAAEWLMEKEEEARA